MPHYFFNIHSDTGLWPAPEAEEHLDLEAVRMEAILGAKHIVLKALRTGAPFSAAIQKSFEVTDDSGATVLTMLSDNVVVLDTKPSMKRTGVGHNQLPQPPGQARYAPIVECCAGETHGSPLLDEQVEM